MKSMDFWIGLIIGIGLGTLACIGFMPAAAEGLGDRIGNGHTVCHALGGEDYSPEEWGAPDGRQWLCELPGLPRPVSTLRLPCAAPEPAGDCGGDVGGPQGTGPDFPDPPPAPEPVEALSAPEPAPEPPEPPDEPEEPGTQPGAPGDDRPPGPCCV